MKSSDYAKETLQIEAKALLASRDRVGEQFDKAVAKSLLN